MTKIKVLDKESTDDVSVQGLISLLESAFNHEARVHGDVFDCITGYTLYKKGKEYYVKLHTRNVA